MARRGKRKSKGGATKLDEQSSSPSKKHREPKIVEQVDDEDDEEIDEDEAFNSEDERMYGHFFNKKSQGDGDEDEDEESGEEVTSDEDDDNSEDDNDDDDDGQYMLDLLAKLDSSGGKSNKVIKDTTNASHMAKLSESEYSSTVSKKGLTIDSLMQGLEDTQGFKNLQKTFAKQQSATSAPLDKVVADRTQRKIVYESQSKDISRWTKVVQENRQAETLDFKPKERLNITRDTLVDKFEPTTEFEKELEQALEEAGQQDEEAVLKAEEQALQDDLGANRLTMEEYKKRRGQLAQVRALMFYHEQKRHHIKKIKSKKYRKIRKKQRERLKDAAMEAAAEEDADYAEELKEKEETARIQERMTLAHKNTSKWAKRVLKRGKNVDIETRRALSAQLKRGDDLRRKMMGDDESDSEGDSDEDLAESARKVLEDDGPDPTQGKSGLFKLSFMQKGMIKQHDKAKDEARRLLSELRAEEEEQGIVAGSDDFEEQAPKKEKIASDQEMKAIMNGGELVASSLAFGNSNAIATSGGIEIDISGDPESDTNGDPPGIASGVTEHVSTFQPKDSSSSPAGGDRPANKESETKKSTEKPVVQASTRKRAADEEEANPWLQPVENTASSSTTPSSIKAQITPSKKKAKKGMVDVEGAIDILDAGKSNSVPGSTTKSEAKTEGETDPKTKITMLSQEELVRRAFATQSEKEIDEEFKNEKEAITLENDPTRKVSKKKDPTEVAGWGSWTGAGAPPPRPPRKLPKKLQPPKKKKQDPKRRDAGKRDVIINQKRLKKLANTYMLADVPHPFASRAEYEQSMLGGVGKEWNVTSAVKNMTRPEILTRAGKIIQPISKKAKVARAPAKF